MIPDGKIILPIAITKRQLLEPLLKSAIETLK
jgi:hypothetical protein